MAGAETRSLPPFNLSATGCSHWPCKHEPENTINFIVGPKRLFLWPASMWFHTLLGWLTVVSHAVAVTMSCHTQLLTGPVRLP